MFIARKGFRQMLLSTKYNRIFNFWIQLKSRHGGFRKQKLKMTFDAIVDNLPELLQNNSSLTPTTRATYVKFVGHFTDFCKEFNFTWTDMTALDEYLKHRSSKTNYSMEKLQLEKRAIGYVYWLGGYSDEKNPSKTTKFFKTKKKECLVSIPKKRKTEEGVETLLLPCLTTIERDLTVEQVKEVYYNYIRNKKNDNLEISSYLDQMNNGMAVEFRKLYSSSEVQESNDELTTLLLSVFAQLCRIDFEDGESFFSNFLSEYHFKAVQDKVYLKMSLEVFLYILLQYDGELIYSFYDRFIKNFDFVDPFPFKYASRMEIMANFLVKDHYEYARRYYLETMALENLHEPTLLEMT